MTSESNDPRNDRNVERLLAGSPARFDAEAALARFRARRPAARAGRLPVGPVRALTAAAALVIVAGALTIGGVASSFLQIFEPKTFVAITFDPRDLAGLPDLSSYGRMTWGGPPSPHRVASVAAASAEAGFTPRQPSVASLPAGAGGGPEVTVISRTTGTFTFDAAAAQAAAARVGRTPPPMPANMNGATLRGDAGPAIVQTWTSGDRRAGTTVVVAQGRAPTLAAEGVTLDQLREYLLAQPGMPPQVAAQLRAIADPSSTLPVPVPVGQASTKTVRVQGVSGLFIGDSTGLGAGVVWRQGEFAYAVGGSLTEAQVLSIANSLRE